MIQEVKMTLKEEVELLERKVRALEKVKELEQGYFITYSTFNTYQWQNEPKIPTRMKDVDPVVKDLMLSPECNFIS